MEYTGERFVPNIVDHSELELEHLQRYYSITNLVKGQVVVDAASGEGYGSSILAGYASTVYGVDISDEAVTEAKQKYTQDNLFFLNASVESIPLDDDSVDVFVSFETIEHVNEATQQAFLKEIKRVLKKTGIVVISTPNKEVYSNMSNYSNEFHVKEFYKQEFYNFLLMYFPYVKFYYQRFQIASFIENGSENVEVISVDKGSEPNGKYIIAVCSDNEQSANSKIGSVIMDENNQYENQIKRILQLQDEVEERNKHIKYLDEYIENRNQIIRQQNNRIEELSLWGQSQGEELKRTYSTIQELNQQVQDLKQKVEVLSNQISALEQLAAGYAEESTEKDVQVENLNGHIYSLLEQERNLNNIYESDGWKWLKRYYKVRDGLIPRNTKRLLLTKMLVRFVRDPRAFMRHLNPENIKKFFKYLKSGNTSLLGDRVDHYLEKFTSNLKPELQIYKSDMFDPLVFKSFKEPKVSIIIPVFNQWQYTYSCLKAILENTKEVTYEIIIADDLSSDKTKEISTCIENIVHIRNEQNLGFLLNCNHAAQYAKGQYILFLNNDTNVQANWLKPLVELIESNDGIGMVGSKLVYADGRLQEAGGIIWNDASGWNYGHLDDPEKPEYNYVKEVDYLSGASIMIRAPLWKEIGGFDESFAPAYYEDSDLAFEIRKHGYKVMYQPKSVVVHFEGVSNGTDTTSGQKAYQVVNQKRFYEKWKKILEREHFPNGETVFHARDRSRMKKTVLFIDHYVPTYDKDAGSRTIFQYLKLVIGMEYNVKFIGDNFYKHEPYATELEQMGIEVLYGPYYATHWKDWIKQNGADLDVVFMNRPHISAKYIDWIKEKTSSNIIYNVCDLHFLRERRQYEITNDRCFLESSEKWKKIEYKIMEKADVVFTLSTYERDIINTHFKGNKAMICPVFIYDMFEEALIKPTEKRDLIFVGGFSHTPNVDGVTWFIKEIFPRIQAKIPPIKFHIVGSNVPDEIKSLVYEGIILHGFVSDTVLDELYKKCRICVIPLRFGAGVKGKTIEAMYQQVAIVSTSIGIEGLEGVETCIQAKNSAEEFANEVVELYQNEEQIMMQAKGNLKFVHRHFSKDSATELFETVFKR